LATVFLFCGYKKMLNALEQFQIEMTEENHDARNTVITLSAMYGGEGPGVRWDQLLNFVSEIWPSHV
jgi:hypothetical protein